MSSSAFLSFPQSGMKMPSNSLSPGNLPCRVSGLKACIKSKALMPPSIFSCRSLAIFCLLSAISISDIGSKTSYLVIVTLPGASITLSQLTVPRPCTQCSFIPSFAITISTHPHHKEMDIQILETAVQSLTSLDLNCFFIALPY